MTTDPAIGNLLLRNVPVDTSVRESDRLFALRSGVELRGFTLDTVILSILAWMRDNEAVITPNLQPYHLSHPEV